jgi:D-glycero-alpha-D-manno-heptose 1-phosphate guanylyltransferase
MDRICSEAMILAGGLGTRLRSAVSDRPKPMAAVLDQPFIAFLLHQLVRHGFRRAILCVGYMGEYVPKALGSTFGPLQLVYSFEHTPLGTGGALRNAYGFVRDDDILVMNGDSFCDLDLMALPQLHRSFGGAATMAVLQQSDRRQAGAVKVGADGRVVEFESRPAVPAPGLINSGVYMFRRDALQSIPEETMISLEEHVFPAMVKQGALYAAPVEARFIDIGTPESYAAAQTFFSCKGE